MEFIGLSFFFVAALLLVWVHQKDPEETKTIKGDSHRSTDFFFGMNANMPLRYWKELHRLGGKQ